MKRASFIFSVRIAPVLALGIAVACGSDVIEEDGKGGTSSTTATVASVTTGPGPSTNVSAASTTKSVQASATTGAGDACMQACDHAAMCGVPACQLLNPDCSMMQGQCLADCINDADCTQIQSLLTGNMDPVLSACLSGCQGGQGGGGGGGNIFACGQCANGAGCIDGCGADPACADWGMCALQCSTPQCFADCNAMFPAAEAGYRAVYTCACNSCESDCSGVMNPCDQPMGQGQGGGGGAGGN